MKPRGLALGVGLAVSLSLVIGALLFWPPETARYKSDETLTRSAEIQALNQSQMYDDAIYAADAIRRHPHQFFNGKDSFSSAGITVKLGANIDEITLTSGILSRNFKFPENTQPIPPIWIEGTRACMFIVDTSPITTFTHLVIFRKTLETMDYRVSACSFDLLSGQLRIHSKAFEIID